MRGAQNDLHLYFENLPSRRMRTLLLCVSMSLFCLACQPAPISTPQPSTPIGETPADISKRPESDGEAAPKPHPETIARLLPESRIGTPEKDLASRRLEYNTLITSRSSASRQTAAWQYRMTRQGQIVGFEFSNYGGNRILPPRRDALKNQFFTRDFQFRFDERARQDIHLMISDWVASRDRVFRLSEIANSLMLFFPRVLLPAVVNFGERYIVTLPTGEEVEFDAETHEIRGGVFSESPVDLNPDRTARKFPGVEYSGKGVIVRVNSRGTDPRINNTAMISTGTAPQNCDHGISCNQCQVPSKDLWDQSGAVRFKFATDVDFDRFLVARCGFALPRVGADFAVLTPVQ